MGKAKPAKHTASEIKNKVHAATTNMGGGKAGLQDRLGGKVGHAKYKCPICMTAAPDLKSMQVRDFSSRNWQTPFTVAFAGSRYRSYTNLFQLGLIGSNLSQQGTADILSKDGAHEALC